MVLTPDAIVTQLLRVHLGLAVVASSANDNAIANVRSFRDLFQLPTLCALPAKRALLRAAEATGCAGVQLDVLLFLSHTMAPSAFTRELVTMPTSLDQWVHYLSEQCVVEHASVTLESLHGVLALYSATKRFQDLAALLLTIMRSGSNTNTSSSSNNGADHALHVARDVAAVMQHYRHTIPKWIVEFVTEYIALRELEITTEQHDLQLAPPVCNKSGAMDKRARGATHLQANWRMRTFTLDAHSLTYAKHAREKGRVVLTCGMQVAAYTHNGTLSRRPHCIRIGDGANALIVDACTPVGQREWLAALHANIQRLALAPVWLQFPRPSMPGQTMAAFLRYCLLYHSSAESDKCDCDKCNKSGPAPWRPQMLRARFQLDDRRVYFALLQTLAHTHNWRAFEAQTHDAQVSSNGGSRFQSTSHSSTTKGSGELPRFDPLLIGYGAILDLVVDGGGPRALVEYCDNRFHEHEARSAGRRAWSCRSASRAEHTLSLRPDTSGLESTSSSRNSSST